MTKKQNAMALIQKLEDCKLYAYLDTRGIPTIGIGTTKYPNGKLVRLGDTCITSQAQEWLMNHLEKNIFPIVDKISLGLSDGVYVALCSLGYNIGSALSGDSILKALKTRDLNSLATAFRLYCKERINGELKFSHGLLNRRNIEIKEFLNV